MDSGQWTVDSVTHDATVTGVEIGLHRSSYTSYSLRPGDNNVGGFLDPGALFGCHGWMRMKRLSLLSIVSLMVSLYMTKYDPSAMAYLLS